MHTFDDFSMIGRLLPGVKLTRPLSLRVKAYLSMIRTTFLERNLSPTPRQLQVLGALVAISEGSDDDPDPSACRVIGNSNVNRPVAGEVDELVRYYGIASGA